MGGSLLIFFNNMFLILVTDIINKLITMRMNEEVVFYLIYIILFLEAEDVRNITRNKKRFI